MFIQKKYFMNTLQTPTRGKRRTLEGEEEEEEWSRADSGNRAARTDRECVTRGPWLAVVARSGAGCHYPMSGKTNVP